MSTDFKDFKSVAEELRLLSIRKDEDGNTINWTAIRKLRVSKKYQGCILFKTSHLQNIFKTMRVTRVKKKSSYGRDF
jgi:hypothetical protein